MAPVYTAAVVGAGAGGTLSIKALMASPRYQLIAVTDLREEVRRAIEHDYPGMRTFATHQEMLAACPTDVVCVSTWPPSHLAVTRDALALPLKGILVEKPLADKHADGQTLLALIRQAQLPVVVPHGLLVAEHSRQVLELVHHGHIGELKLVEIQCRGWDIINAGIHWLDFVVALTWNAPAVSVLAACDSTTRTYRDGMQVETEAVTYIQLRNGLRVVMQTGDYVEVAEPGAGILFRLVGSQGMIEFFGWKSAYRLYDAKDPQGKLVEVTPNPRSNHQLYLDLLADQIDHNQTFYTWADYSLTALEWCEAAYLSNKHRCAIHLPLAQFSPPPIPDWDPGQPYSGSGGGRDGRKLP
jgi:predicted dehydrogenase